MKHPIRWVVSALLAVAILPTAASASKVSVKIANASDWDIHHFHLSPVDKDDWGPDWLGDEVVSKGGSFTLTDIPCGEYDLKIVDEEGTECVASGVDICGANQSATITNDLLEACAADDDGGGDDDDDK